MVILIAAKTRDDYRKYATKNCEWLQRNEQLRQRKRGYIVLTPSAKSMRDYDQIFGMALDKDLPIIDLAN
jgi:hypothetical protein